MGWFIYIPYKLKMRTSLGNFDRSSLELTKVYYLKASRDSEAGCFGSTPEN